VRLKNDDNDLGFLFELEERIGFEPTALQFCKLFPWTTRAPLPSMNLNILIFSITCQ
jgi:hypothetical protein